MSIGEHLGRCGSEDNAVSFSGVDGAAGKVYLTRTMLARILAAFAFITGLAAIGTPAEARLFSALSQPADSAATSGQQSGAQQSCRITAPKPPIAGKAEVQPGCRQRKPVIIYIPTIQFGPDRAHE